MYKYFYFDYYIQIFPSIITDIEKICTPHEEDALQLRNNNNKTMN